MRMRDEGIAWQELDGELVILDSQRSVYLTTNEAGAMLAKLLVEERSTDDLTSALVAAYGIDRSAARADVEAFVSQLETKRLLR